MLESFENSQHEYLCHSLEDDEIVNTDNRFEFLNSLTELRAKRTDEFAWFTHPSGNLDEEHNRAIRIKILKQCIEETY
jgi:hypothetical protein